MSGPSVCRLTRSLRSPDATGSKPSLPEASLEHCRTVGRGLRPAATEEPSRRLQAPAIDASLNGSPPVMPPRRYLAEPRAKSLLAQEARTVDRIGRLFVQRFASSKRRSPSAPPHIDESAKPMLPRRGKGSKWYGIRVGWNPGICDSWAECKARVDGGIRCAEYRSFRSAKEAMDYVKAANLGRRVCYMNLTTCQTSFVGGRAMRAVVRVVQQGETTTREHICCLDAGSDVNLASRYLLHDVRRVDIEPICTSSEEIRFEEEGTLFLLVAGAVKGVPALEATPDQLPYQCEVLLGVPGVDDLGV
jgi:hypothetical protein